MEQINSAANPKIKLAVSLQQKKYRDKYNLFLLEGLRNAETAANAGAKIDMCFCTPEIVQNERAQKFLASLTCPIYEVSENIFSKISDTKSPQGLMLVVQKNDCSVKRFDDIAEKLPTDFGPVTGPRQYRHAHPHSRCTRRSCHHLSERNGRRFFAESRALRYGVAVQSAVRCKSK